MLLQERVYMPPNTNMRENILDEAHYSAYVIHPGETKMYQMICSHYRWLGMKKQLTNHVSSCVVYPKAKFDHQELGGLLQTLPILLWKFEDITMDFMSGFLMVIRKDAVWVIVDRLTKLVHLYRIGTLASPHISRTSYILLWR